jgi:agmatinase
MDLRDDYNGLKLSHATVMRRVMETVGPDRLLQYGIRSGTREEWALSEENGTLLNDPETIPDMVGDSPLYLSLDLDVLDPSVLPETGAPEPGGISFSQLHEVILACRGLNIVAGDVVEYCPYPGAGGPSGAVAAKVVRELIFLCAEGK